MGYEIKFEFGENDWSSIPVLLTEVADDYKELQQLAPGFTAALIKERDGHILMENPTGEEYLSFSCGGMNGPEAATLLLLCRKNDEWGANFGYQIKNTDFQTYGIESEIPDAYFQILCKVFNEKIEFGFHLQNRKGYEVEYTWKISNGDIVLDEFYDDDDDED